MNIQLVVAVDNQGALGKNKTMAWYIPQELRHFKALTMGGVIVMGRVTFESIGRPLPGRVSVVVSSNAPPDQLPPDTHWVASIQEALALATAQYPDKTVWIGGGARRGCIFPGTGPGAVEVGVEPGRAPRERRACAVHVPTIRAHPCMKPSSPSIALGPTAGPGRRPTAAAGQTFAAMPA